MSIFFPTLNEAAAKVQDDDPRLGTTNAVRFHSNGDGTFRVTFTFPEGEPVVAEGLDATETFLAGTLLGRQGYVGALDPETDDFIWTWDDSNNNDPA